MIRDIVNLYRTDLYSDPIFQYIYVIYSNDECWLINRLKWLNGLTGIDRAEGSESRKLLESRYLGPKTMCNELHERY